MNAWNRNLFPWFLLWPQGVSGAIRRRAGSAPFRELLWKGLIPLGGAVLTGAGRLPFRGIIHVAGISLAWVASETSIRSSVRNAMRIVDSERFGSVAFPVIGTGTGGFGPEGAYEIMNSEFHSLRSTARVLIVRYDGRAGRKPENK